MTDAIPVTGILIGIKKLSTGWPYEISSVVLAALDADSTIRRVLPNPVETGTACTHVSDFQSVASHALPDTDL